VAHEFFGVLRGFVGSVGQSGRCILHVFSGPTKQVLGSRLKVVVFFRHIK
jgi:hypothetical protein